MSPRLPQPQTVLRVSAVACLAGAFLCALGSRGAAGPTRELAGFLLIPFLLFGLFYLQYAIVRGIIHRDLDARLGYLQALGCAGITVVAVLAIAWAASAGAPSPSGLQENVLLLMGGFGELVFLGNVVWTYEAERRPQPEAPRVAGKNTAMPQNTRSWAWPASPAWVFVIAAAFFGVIGIFLASARPLSARLPFPSDEGAVQVAAGYMWMLAATPFAVFALAYALIEYFGEREFEISPTKIHFVCTLFLLAEAVREYTSWASTWANPSALNSDYAGQSGVFAFGLLALAAFAWNVWTSRKKPAHQSEVEADEIERRR